MKNLGLKTRLKNPRDAFWDLKLRINTFGFVPAVGKPSDPDFQVHYVPTPYRKAFSILNHIGLGPDDTFADLGCGLGRVVFCANWLGVRKSIGVDINETLIAAAKDNVTRSGRSVEDVEFLAQPAQDTDFDDITAIYMFHPFGSGTMQEVMERLGDSLAKKPRNFRLAYENPVNAHVVDTVNGLHRIAEWPVDAGSGSTYAVTFWSTDPKT